MSGYLTREEKDKWKEDVINSRFEDFKELLIWLKEKGIKFEETPLGVELAFFDITNTLQIKFPRSRKKYQYNLEGIKKRILQDQ